MQFLKTIFWVLIAVLVVLFGSWNWHPVTINLWANLQADIKLPVLLLIAFLIGWLPTWLIHRARLWTLRRRLEVYERQKTGSATTAPAIPVEVGEPVE
jgi:uncharacterized integral membrane protein